MAKQPNCDPPSYISIYTARDARGYVLYCGTCLWSAWRTGGRVYNDDNSEYTDDEGVYDGITDEEQELLDQWECESRVLEAARAWSTGLGAGSVEHERTTKNLRTAVDVLEGRRLKFAKCFWTPYEEYKGRIGHTFTVIGAAVREEDEAGTRLYPIRFDSDRHVVMALEEEVIAASQAECYKRNPGLDRPVPELIR